MKSVDPDVRDGDLMSLEMIPGADGDACHVEWREMVVDDVMMEKFVLVPQVCPVDSMTSAAEPTFLPALSEVYSPVCLARVVANPLAVVESDTARVSAIPVVGLEVPVCFGKVALDSVGLRVGLLCFRLDLEETRPALPEERGVTRDIDLGVTPEGGPVEGRQFFLEPLEHSVREKSLDGGFTEGVPVLWNPLEHSVLGETPDGGRMVEAPVLELIEHSVPERALDDRPMAGIAVLDPPKHSMLDVSMNSLWMAPWDAGGMFRIGSRQEVVIRRDRLGWFVQLSCRPAFGGLTGTCVIDLYAGVSTTPVEIMVEDKMPDFLDFLELASTDSRGCDYVYSPDGSSKTNLFFSRASCTHVEMFAVDSNFSRASCTPVEMCAWLIRNFSGRAFRRARFAWKDRTI